MCSSHLWCSLSCQSGANLSRNGHLPKINATKNPVMCGYLHIAATPSIWHDLYSLKGSRVETRCRSRPEKDQLDVVRTDRDCVKTEEHRGEKEPTRNATCNDVEHTRTRPPEYRAQLWGKLRCDAPSANQVCDGGDETNEAGRGYKINGPVCYIVENHCLHRAGQVLRDDVAERSAHPQPPEEDVRCESDD
jgi:hypothetical protein